MINHSYEIKKKPYNIYKEINISYILLEEIVFNVSDMIDNDLKRQVINEILDKLN